MSSLERRRSVGRQAAEAAVPVITQMLRDFSRAMTAVNVLSSTGADIATALRLGQSRAPVLSHGFCEASYSGTSRCTSGG